MRWLTEHWLRLLFIGAYLALLAHHCRKARAATRDLGDYLVAGRSLGGWVIALSFYATFVSTNTFVGHAGKGWDIGLIWCVKGLVMALSAYAAWYLVAPRFCDRAREYGSLTLPDFLGHRYGSTVLRRVAALVIIGASVVYLIAVYKGSATALQQFLGIGYRPAAVAIFLVVTAYTLAGGFRSVVLTDAVQAVIMLAGAVGLLAAVLYRGGGLSQILHHVRAQDPALVSWQGHMPLMALIGLSVAGGMKLLVDPRQISRLYGLKDEKALGLARVASPLMIVVTYLCLLPIGAFAHALIPASAVSDSDQVIPYLLGTSELLGPALSSFFLLVLLSATMSSLDSVLLVAASSVGRDLLLIGDEDPRAIQRTRVSVVSISLGSMLLALEPAGDIVSISAFSGSLYAASFLPTLVGGMYWKGGTARGALAAVLVGSCTVIGWHQLRSGGWTGVHEVYVGTAAAALTYFALSRMGTALMARTTS